MIIIKNTLQSHQLKENNKHVGANHGGSKKASKISGIGDRSKNLNATA